MVPLVPAAAGVLALALTVDRFRASRRLRAVPHFSGNRPILGYTGIVKLANEGKLHHVWEDMVNEANAVNAPAIQLVVLTGHLVVLATPEAAQVVLKSQEFVPKYSEGYKTFRFMGCKAESLLSLASAEEHARLRKEFAQFFTAANIDKVLSRLTHEVARSCDAVTAAAAAAGGVAAVDMLEVGNDLIDCIVQHVFFGMEERIGIGPFFDTLHHMGEVAASGIKIDLITHGLDPGFFRWRRNWHACRKLWATLMAHAYSGPLPDEAAVESGGLPFWAVLRRAFPDAMRDRKQYEDCMANFMLVYGAGLETTAGAIGMILAATALDRASMTKLESELEEHGLLASADNPAPRAPTASELAQLPFLNALFHEGMRVFPPAPSGTLRRLAQDTDVCGTVLPKGTCVDIPMWALHRSKAAWGEDAKQWRPARWLEGRSANAIKRTPTGAQRWLPFSDGRQNCVGQQLATMETKLTLAMFVARFSVEADVERMPKCTTADAFAADCTAYTSLRRIGGVHLRMTPRVAA